jgi:ATP-dependent DNA helicase PIF1
MQFSPDQEAALSLLISKKNVFLTGRAGTGKSTLLKELLRRSDPETTAVLASTGAAAILIGGRTFHSFFGLGILEGGAAKTVERALKNPLLKRRIKKTHTIIVDEISMLNGETLAAAEEIARKARLNDMPWGNLRVVAVGDFAQLPPVSRHGQKPDWAFRHEVWERSNFHSIQLEKVHRSQDNEWTEVLNLIREGICDERVKALLDSRKKIPEGEVTRLFGLRQDAENYNRECLDALPSEEVLYPTKFLGDANAIEQLKRNSPVPEELVLKLDALVMLRKNDTDGFYVNGSLAKVIALREDAVKVELLDTGLTRELEPVKFELLNAEGEVVASARNFPLNLAYGSTIHKSQGSTLERLRVKLAGLWESGHAYVALSRVRHPSGLFLDGWRPDSIRVDPEVSRFHSSLPQSAAPL